MKAELTQENKVKFFALYWGQNLLPVSYWGSNNKIDQGVFHSKNIHEFENSWLNLKPLSQISDEDAIEVGNLYGGFIDTPDDLQNYKDHVYLALIEDDEEAYAMWDHIGFQIMSQVIDFLRSRGYALPWMGLSVDELVAAGWIRLV